MPLTGHPIFRVGTSNTPRKPRQQQEAQEAADMPRQHIIKAVSPSPEPEDEEKVPSSPPTMPSTDTANDSDPTTSVDGRSDTPALSKTTSNSASKYTPSTYLPPSNTTELPDTATATTPLIETEDTREAEEEHETPLLPLNSEVVNASTPRSTGAFILLWAVGIILAPLAVAMCYAAYCICLEFDLQRWLDIMPSMESLPFIGRTAKELGAAAVEEIVIEVSEGHVEL